MVLQRPRRTGLWTNLNAAPNAKEKHQSVDAPYPSSPDPSASL